MNTTAGWLQAAAFLVVVTLLVPPVGTYLARVFGGGRTWLDGVCADRYGKTYLDCTPEQQKEIDTRFMAELEQLGSDFPYQEFCDLADA